MFQVDSIEPKFRQAFICFYKHKESVQPIDQQTDQWVVKVLSEWHHLTGGQKLSWEYGTRF